MMLEQKLTFDLEYYGYHRWKSSTTIQSEPKNGTIVFKGLHFI